MPKKPPHRNVLLSLGWYYPAIHRGVAKFARDNSWHLTADIDDPVPRNWKGDGVVALVGQKESFWNQLRKIKTPIVDLSESRPKIKLPRVTVDNKAIAALAAEYFINRGFSNFTFIHRWELGVSRARRDHFAKAVKQAGFESAVLSWGKEKGDKEDDRQERHRWLRRRLAQLPKPNAVFCARDIEAVEVIEACEAAKIQSPDEVAILGVDNEEVICECLRCPLSSIALDWERVGFEGSRRLQDLMDGKPDSGKTIYIPPTQIVERMSTDGFAVSNPMVAKALLFIRENLEKQIQVVDILKHVSVSRTGLEKGFRESFPRAPMEELRRLRLDLAKQLLRTTDNSIVQVAFQSGFQTSHNLCRTFKREMNTTPVSYRKSLENDENS